MPYLFMKRYLCLFRGALAAFWAATVCLGAFTCDAATRIWDGGGTSGFWDAAANWSNNAAPINGDVLIFPPSASRTINTNRASGGITNLGSIQFTGDDYELFSAPLNIT